MSDPIPMSPEEIAALAEGLTDAQREVVTRFGNPTQSFYPARQHRACDALGVAGVLTRSTDNVGNILWRLTPLGLAVRHHLQKGQP